VPDELVNASRAAAEMGVEAFGKYWALLPQDKRELLATVYQAHKKIAATAAKPKAKTPAPPPAATNAMAASYDAVMAAMLAAEDAEKLQEAADLIGAVESPEERANLSAAYHDLMANFKE
jgi:DNA-binding MurR/RpiR family transcriptional regulator